MNKYGNVRYTDTQFKAYFRFWNKDYVTGKMLLEAGYPLPGVDYDAYRKLAAEQGVTMVTQQTDAESQDAQSANISLGSFTDASGFTMTDVTAKWGAIGSASPRYTGDIGMSMVPYSADVAGEEMSYMAMSNLDGLANPTKVSGMGNILDDAGTAMKYGGAGVGVGTASLGILGGGALLLFATVGATQMIAGRKSAEKLANKLADGMNQSGSKKDKFWSPPHKR